MTINTMLKMVKDLTDDISDQIKMYDPPIWLDEADRQLAKEYLIDITMKLFDIKLKVMPECVQDEKEDNIPDLVEYIGTPAMLEQLAEECCELGKAALKQSREMRGENATHKNPDDIRNNLIEEIADVSVSIYQVVKNTGFITEEEVQEMADRKTERMKKRLEEDDEKIVKETAETAKKKEEEEMTDLLDDPRYERVAVLTDENGDDVALGVLEEGSGLLEINSHGNKVVLDLETVSGIISSFMGEDEEDNEEDN